MTDQYAKLEHAWELTRGWNRLNSPASEHQIAAFEKSKGRSIPHDMRALIARHNGLQIIDNTFIASLPHEHDSHNDWDVIHPDAAKQFLSFGNDGSEGQYGLWCRRSGEGPSPVIEFVEFDWSPHGMNVVSIDLAAFLTARTVYYLLLRCDEWECPIPHIRERASKVSRGAWNEALDVLEVPARIIQLTTCMDDAAYKAVQLWAEPDLDGPPTREEGWTNESLANALGQ